MISHYSWDYHYADISGISNLWTTTYSHTLGNNWLHRSNDTSTWLILFMIQSLKILFSKWWALLLYIALIIIQFGLWCYSTDINIMFWNYGAVHTWSDIVLSILTFILFPLFIFAFFYKSYMFWNHSTKTSEKSGFLGGIIATIISWSSCCGLTLASYFWLLPLMNFLPWSGIEIKLIATILLGYATIITLKNMTSCDFSKKKK